MSVRPGKKQGRGTLAPGKYDVHLTLDEVLFRSARAKAAMEGRRIGDVVTALLKKYVTEPKA
jgi:hypothetical protein